MHILTKSFEYFPDVEDTLAGGGPGSRLYDVNGFDAYEPPAVDYIGDYQGATTPVAGLGRVLTGSLPDSAARVRGLADWLDEQAPDAVVCSGYSTVMEAAVAGTQCVVVPATNEQRGIASRLEPVAGFAVAETPADVTRAVDEVGTPPSFANGVAAIAERVVDDLAEVRVAPRATVAD